MSDLGAIFHVKKDGVQYDAHAYTTLDECPEPNLKLMYKGQQGYVKLVDKGSGDVPCYVKPKSGSTVYQVKKSYQSVPTGSAKYSGIGSTITVPAGVTVFKITVSRYGDIGYVGVTPGKTYQNVKGEGYIWDAQEDRVREQVAIFHDMGGTRVVPWARFGNEGDNLSNSYHIDFTLSWSPEINKMKPTYTDY